MKTITGTTGAWLAEWNVSRGADRMEIDNLSFAEHDMTAQGWVKVGDAEITIHLIDDSAVASAQIIVLEEFKRKLMADTQAKLTMIEGQIQSLRAIEYKPSLDHGE